MLGWCRQGGAHSPGEILGSRASLPVLLLRVRYSLQGVSGQRLQATQIYTL